IAVGDQSEHPGGILESAAPVAAQPVAHGAGLDINIMPRGRIARCCLNHMLDVADLKSAGDDTPVVERIDATQLQDAGLAGTIDGPLYVLVDELEEPTDSYLVNLHAHVILPPSL